MFDQYHVFLCSILQIETSPNITPGIFLNYDFIPSHFSMAEIYSKIFQDVWLFVLLNTVTDKQKNSYSL